MSIPQLFRLPSKALVAFLLIIIIAAAPLEAKPSVPASAESVGLSQERLERIEQYFSTLIGEDRLPGAVVQISRHGQTAYLKAFGQRDREAGEAMKTDSIFRIASQSKAIVSAAILILQEEGKLLISDAVGDYIPEFNETRVAEPTEDGGLKIVSAKRKVTLRDLLTHTAGVDYGEGAAKELWNEAGIQGWYFANREEPIGETVARIAKLPFQSQPGERWVYGYSTDILGAVIEKASGMPLDAFLQDRLFDPLQMEDTHFYLPEEKADRLTVVYQHGEDGTLKRSQEKDQGAYVEGPRQSFSGGAGLLSTAQDYSAFLQMMLDGGTFHGERILSRKTVELMTVDHLTDQNRPADWAGQGFGLGFSILLDVGQKGTPGSPGVFGWGGAYHTVYWVDPVEDLVVTYFTQLRPARGIKDHDTLRALVYQAIAD